MNRLSTWEIETLDTTSSMCKVKTLDTKCQSNNETLRFTYSSNAIEYNVTQFSSNNPYYILVSTWMIWPRNRDSTDKVSSAHDLNVLFNTLLTITLHNTQKRRRRKERTTYGPLTRYSRLVTRPVRNPDRQGLTWVPLPNRVSRRLLRDTYFYRVKKLFSSTAIVWY